MTRTSGKPRCMGTIEFRTHTSYWENCILDDGHLGPCMDARAMRKSTVRLPPVQLYLPGYDANGTPCE